MIMDEYINQLLAEMPGEQSTLHDVVENIIDEPISGAIKRRLLKPLLPEKPRPYGLPRTRKEWKRKAILEEFDPVPPQKTLRAIQDYQKEILEGFAEKESNGR